jgi:hypothetical protein
VLFNIVYYYKDTKHPIAYKYLTHGSIIEPTCFFRLLKYKNIKFIFKFLQIFKIFIYKIRHYFEFETSRNLVIKNTTTNFPIQYLTLKSNKFTIKLSRTNKLMLTRKGVRHFSSSMVFLEKKDLPSLAVSIDSATLPLDLVIKPVKFYDNIYELKTVIIKDNKNKSGVYKFNNKLNGNFYIGSSVNLSRRFNNYFSLSYISKVKNHLTISRAIIKYGYSNFELEILEYCDVSDLLLLEQFYIDKLKPAYNIAKIAGSTLGIKKTKEQRENISNALKGKYVGIKSALFGKTISLETKKLMSLSRT